MRLITLETWVLRMIKREVNKMVKAVFFDWMNTLVHPEPDRHELYCQAFRELGIELSPQKVIRGIYAADNEMPAGIPVRWSEGKDEEPFIRFQEIVLAEAGVKLSRETIRGIPERLRQLFKGATFALYDDVLPTLKTLKQRGLILGLLTGLSRDIRLTCHKLGLEPYLSFVVTTQEVGADKPEPPIFLAALERAKVKAQEAVCVGDQYQRDVVGARGVGITPILIDRYDLEPGVSDCPRIHNLAELDSWL